jgi:hypothetical protein
VLLYIERWLKAPVQMEDGSVVPRTAGTPQGGVNLIADARRDPDGRATGDGPPSEHQGTLYVPAEEPGGGLYRASFLGCWEMAAVPATGFGSYIPSCTKS